jgi:hypothetical protein
MPARRSLVGVLAILVLMVGCTRGSGDRLVASKGAAHHSQELASGPEPTVADAQNQREQLQTAIAAGDDISPTVRTPRPAAPARSSSGGGHAAPAAKPSKSSGSGKAVGSAGGKGPWTPGPDAANSWAVVIGITNYKGPTHATYGGVGDANAFVEALRKSGWAEDHVLVLRDGAASGGAMRNAMQWLVDHSGPNTFTVFHYSGHVKQKGVGNEYLWSQDNQFIANTEFGGYMSKLQGRAWVDVAGCEAAGFDRGISNGSRLFTAASGETEKGYENPDWHESIWTGLSIDQGVLQGQADANHDGKVTIGEAANYGQSRAPGMTQGQSHGPQHPVVKGVSGGNTDWVLGRPAPPPQQPPPPSNGGGGGGGGGGGNPPPSTPPTSDPCGALTKGITHC